MSVVSFIEFVKPQTKVTPSSSINMFGLSILWKISYPMLTIFYLLFNTNTFMMALDHTYYSTFSIKSLIMFFQIYDVPLGRCGETPPRLMELTCSDPKGVESVESSMIICSLSPSRDVKG